MTHRTLYSLLEGDSGAGQTGMPGRFRRKIMEQIILETRALCKNFRNQKAVNQVSLQVPETCVYGLLGSNGAGKSTLLKMVTGMLRPSSGEILLEDKPWTREALRKIGALIEAPAIYHNLSARENLQVRTTLLGLPERCIDEALEKVRLTGTGKKQAGKFSLGMRQRLGIAAALLGNPKLLILDEPTNGLDPFGIQELREMIRRFPAEGITVILSSHILSEVEQTADYIGILVNGRLGWQGSLPEKGRLEEKFMEIGKEYREVENYAK